MTDAWTQFLVIGTTLLSIALVLSATVAAAAALHDWIHDRIQEGKGQK